MDGTTLTPQSITLRGLELHRDAFLPAKGFTSQQETSSTEASGAPAESSVGVVLLLAVFLLAVAGNRL